MLRYVYKDQAITYKDAYILVSLCATLYSKKPSYIHSIEDVYDSIARTVNTDKIRMKKAMKIVLRFGPSTSGRASTDDKLNNFIIDLAESMNKIGAKINAEILQ